MIAQRSFADRAAFESYARSCRTAVPKDDAIVDLCRGRRVLDIGCIDHDLRTVEQLGATWLHGRIRGVAAELTGLDILDDAARELNERGFDIRIADAHDFDLGQKFEVVVAGDIVEHMTNVGSFFDAIARHLEPGGLCIVTTPNPFDAYQMLHVALRRRTAVNQQHAVWFDPGVLWEQVSRSPLRVCGFAWTVTRFDRLERPRWKSRAGWWAIRRLRTWNPLLNSDFAVLLSVDR